MAAAAAATDDDVPAIEGPAPTGKGKKKLILVALPLLLAGAGAGLWFTGILPHALGLTHEHAAASAEPVKPVFVEVPEMVANLSAGPRRQSYVKLRAQLEITRAEDVPVLQAAMPRILDLFQTYLREMSPDELRGAAGTYRLREELIARASLAVAPAKVMDVLFTEVLVQ